MRTTTMAAERVATNWLTLTEAGARAGRSATTIKGWCAAGKLTAHQLVGRVVIDAAELDALLNPPAPAAAPEAGQTAANG